MTADRAPKEDLSKHMFSLRPERIIDQPRHCHADMALTPAGEGGKLGAGDGAGGKEPELRGGNFIPRARKTIVQGFQQGRGIMMEGPEGLASVFRTDVGGNITNCQEGRVQRQTGPPLPKVSFVETTHI